LPSFTYNMTVSFNLLNSFILFGALQGFILSGWLVFTKNKPQAHVYLALMMAILATNSLVTFWWMSEISTTSSNINNDFRFTHLMALGGCLYLYVWKNLDIEPLRKPVWYYFMPVWVDISLRLMVFFASFYVSSVRYQTLQTQHLILTKYLTVVIFWLYLIASFQYFLKNKKQFESEQTDEVQVLSQKWVQNLLIGATIFLIPWSFTMLTADGFYQDQNYNYYYPSELCLVVFIYWVGFAGAHRVQIVWQNVEQERVQLLKALPSEDIESCLKALKKAMETDLLYLNPQLNLTLLATHIGVNHKIISSVLNQELGKGFNEFVNFYRIEWAKKALQANEIHQKTIAEIAFASGFNSIQTFQRVFKTENKCSPKEYLAQLRD
jgi:AraC-like DNA-binding protein